MDALTGQRRCAARVHEAVMLQGRIQCAKQRTNARQWETQMHTYNGRSPAARSCGDSSQRKIRQTR